MTIAYRFCTHCLANFCDNVSKEQKIARVFLPTIDDLMRDHFMYVEFENEVLQDLLGDDRATNVDITEYAESLHVQKGHFPTEEDQAVISEIYQYTTPQHDLSRLSS